jgi:hypothetical protein
MSEKERYENLITAFGFKPLDEVEEEDEDGEVIQEDIDDLINRADEMTESFYMLIGVLAGLLPDSLVKEIYVRVKERTKTWYERNETSNDVTDVADGAMYSLVERVRDEENEDHSDLFTLV